jgi:hypothetical protein
MNKLKFFLVSYDRLYDKVIENLDEQEIKLVNCYAIQKSVPKNITEKVNVLNEWEMSWNDYSYQSKQYYEYSSIVHLTKNPEILEGLTHVGLLHYDIIFNKNSVNHIIEEINNNPNQIFYQRIRFVNDLYLTKYELDRICEFMNEKLQMSINSDKIWTDGWMSEALSVTPVEVFKKFGNFIIDNREEIEGILLNNRWGIMNRINHRICGIIERMWGIYLVSYGYPLVKMNIEHDWNSYVHKHQSEQNWIKI